MLRVSIDPQQIGELGMDLGSVTFWLFLVLLSLVHYLSKYRDWALCWRGLLVRLMDPI